MVVAFLASAALAQVDVVKIPSPLPRMVKSTASFVDYGPLPLQRFATRYQRDQLARDLKVAVKQARETGWVVTMPWDFSQKSTPTRFDRSVISHLVTGVIYLGGAHGSYALDGQTFFLKNGKPVRATLDDLMPGNDSAEFLALLMVPELREQGLVGWEEFQRGVIPKPLLNNFTVDDQEGVTWYFPHYALGAFAEGSYEVTLSWEKLYGRAVRPFAP
jgi:hypothetical protein